MSGGGGGSGEQHLGALNLRRIHAGEWSGAEAARATAHVAGCPECERRLALLAQEQKEFEAQVSFERFSAGVERATRVPRPAGGARGRSRTAVLSLGAAAAALALVAGGQTLFQGSRHAGEHGATTVAGANRTKGATAGPRIEVHIAPPLPRENPQRIAPVDGVERLARGERLRVGVESGRRHFCLVISIDDAGQVTPLFPEDGTSSSVQAQGGLQYLPGAFELTGAGHERLVVILTDRPVEAATLGASAGAALAAAAGDLTRMPDLDLALEGDQFHRIFLKP